MQGILTQLFGRLANRNRRGRQTKNARPRLGIEALEERLVPAAPTDMTELARLFPRHSGPSMLYINFDGWQAEHISPFLTVSGDRDKDIQDILFRTAEIYSPFDVQVVRRFGDGSRATDGGATTIFVGDDSDNGTHRQPDTRLHPAVQFRSRRPGTGVLPPAQQRLLRYCFRRSRLLQPRADRERAVEIRLDRRDQPGHRP
jgi:hypothetical protein